jgi:hypothetical protein
MLTLHLFKKLSETEIGKIAACDGQCNDFSQKYWELSVQTIFIYPRRWRNGNAMSTLMLGNGTLEGILNGYA